MPLSSSQPPAVPSASPPPGSPRQGPSQRDVGLDAVRAVAVIAMVMGHTLDATLSSHAREAPGVQVYWLFRGVTAPLFLCVAGWALTAGLTRSGLAGRALLRRYLPRVALLWSCGVFLRWPGWDLQGLLTFQRPVWQHLLAFDALACVGGSILLACALFAWLPSRGGRVVASLAVLALLPVLTPAVGRWGAEAGLPFPLAQALVAAPSAFPLLPWAAYFFVGVLLREALEATPRVRPSLVVLGLGLLPLAWLCSPLAGLAGEGVQLFFWRLALMLPVAALVLLVPRALAVRLAPVGRASLWAYVLHLPLAYGWSTFSGLAYRLGPTLSFGQAFLAALSVLAVSLALALPAKRYVSPLKNRLYAWVTRTQGRARPVAPVLSPEPLVPPGGADARP